MCIGLTCFELATLGFYAMGKSPGKWLKALLFSKKSWKTEKSHKTVSEKAANFTPKGPSSDLPINSPSVPDSAFHSIDENRENSESAKGPARLSNNEVIFPGNQDIDTKRTVGVGSSSNVEILQQQKAVTKVQAVYRGYLARRAFRALKGIIRLQAVVRGHLVRRQAVATFCCVQGIVKLQALIRGQMVRFSDDGFDVKKACNPVKALIPLQKGDTLGASGYSQLEKISTNAFVTKLLSSTSTPLPLRLQYDIAEPNSAWSWLDRWSTFRFWESHVQSKKPSDLKFQRKHANNSTSAELEHERPKRSVRKAFTPNSDNSLISTPEHERLKQTVKKLPSIVSELVHENPQNELERVKRNLRKISVSTSESCDKLESMAVRPNHVPKKMSNPPATNVSEKPNNLTIPVSHSLDPDVSELVAPAELEKPSEIAVTVFKEPETNVALKLLPPDVLDNDRHAIEVSPTENGGKCHNIPIVNDREVVPKEDQISKGNQKTVRRSLPLLKQDCSDTVSQNTPSLPSYMAATQSAKAKLRGLGSPRIIISQEGLESVSVRRHSLPSAPNGKSCSLSPQVQRLASVKGGPKTDKSFLASRDGHDKAEWRR